MQSGSNLGILIEEDKKKDLCFRAKSGNEICLRNGL